MYCGAVLVIPTAALFKSLIEWAVPLYLVAILLVFLDPYFKELRSQQASANRYIIVIGYVLLNCCYTVYEYSY